MKLIENPELPAIAGNRPALHQASFENQHIGQIK